MTIHAAHHAGEVDPVHAFHLPVEQDDVGIGIAQGSPGVLPVGGFVDLNRAERLQYRDDQLAHVLVVVNDEYFQSVEAIAAHSPPNAPNAIRAPREGQVT